MKMKLNVDIKKFVILILALVVLFIPTYLAIASYYVNQKNPHSQEFTELVLKIPDGTTETFVKSQDSSGMLDFFIAMNRAGEAVDSLPSDYSGESFMLGTFKRENGDTESYKYYFSDNAEKCYFANPDGLFFRISKSDALKFFDTKYSLYLFGSASTPVLTVSGSNVIDPLTMSWNYLVSGIYHNLSFDNTGTAAGQTLDLTNDFDFSFDIVPDECVIKVYSGTELLFEGTPDNLSGFTVERNDTLTFSVNAIWTQTAGCEYYGEAKYSFSVKVTAPSSFSIGESTVEPGALVVISGINVTDPSKVSFTSEPAIGCTPQFYADGDYVRALVPIAADLPAGSYKFTVSYGLTTQTLELTVSAKTFDKSYAYYDVPKSLVDTNYSDADIAEYRKLVGEISAQNESIKYFSDKFMNYEDSGIGIAVGYGKIMLMKYTDNFQHEGVDYMFAQGAEIPAMNSGKVVYVGSCDILGKFVVVDHGWGMKSWYAHMSETSVAVGDVVNKGQTLGKVGSTGFIPTHRLHIAITVAGIPVSPYPLQDFGLIYPAN